MLNTVHFGNYLDFFFEWIPQQIFLLTTFGYMCLLIIKKWTIPWGIEVDTSQAPSIIGQMIALPLKFGSTEGKVIYNNNSASLEPLITVRMAINFIKNIFNIGTSNVNSKTIVHLAQINLSAQRPSSTS
jgi:hypothetical protein